MWLVEKDSSIHFYIADPTATQSPASLRCCFIQIFLVRKIMFTVFCSTNVRNVNGYWNAHQPCEIWSYPCIHENGSKEPGTLCIFLALFLFSSWRGLSEHLWSAFQFSKRNSRTKFRMSIQSGIPRILFSSLFAARDIPRIKPLIESSTSAQGRVPRFQRSSPMVTQLNVYQCKSPTVFSEVIVL